MSESAGQPMRRRAVKITCEVYKSLAPQAEAALAAMRVDSAQVHSRRAIVLRERALLPFLAPTTRLEEDPAEVYEIYVAPNQARGALRAWARALQLFTPGRGTIYAEEVETFDPEGPGSFPLQLAGPDAGDLPDETLSPLSLINCVVQRGRGNDIARCALETGTPVPSINFGVGTGVRDRLGLLRIAIPAEKEVVSLIVEAHEQQALFDALIDAGRLDQPGRGFIAACPILLGVPNTRAFRGPQRHRASMDQLIAAVDQLRAGTAWRRGSGAAGDGAGRTRRGYLRDLVNVTLRCSEGSSERVLATALRAGAGGATISRSKLFSPSGKATVAFPGRELVDLSLDPGQLDGLIRALGDGGAFDAPVACFVETKPLPMAFTYVAG